MKLRGILLVLVVALVSATSSSTTAAAYDSGRDYFSFQDEEITESSGVVASSKRDGVYFTHNDSGGAPELFAVDDRGCTLTKYELKGADGAPITPWFDAEDIARGPHLGESVLWIGDVGDNYHERGTFALRGNPDIVVYRLPEPNSNASTHRESAGCTEREVEPVTVTAYALAFPAEIGHDVETLLADPDTGQLLVVTKAPDLHSFVFAAPLELDADAVNDLTPVGSIVFEPSATYDRDPAAALQEEPANIEERGSPQTPFDLLARMWAVGGDVAPDRDRVVIRTYSDAFEWQIPPTKPGEEPASIAEVLTTTVPARFPLIYERQGEAIAYSRDGTFLMTTCEDAGCTSHRYD